VVFSFFFDTLVEILFFKSKDLLLKQLLVATSLGLLVTLGSFNAHAAAPAKKQTTAQKQKKNVIKAHISAKVMVVKLSPRVLRLVNWRACTPLQTCWT